jgi:hypothetical protein
MFHNDIGNNGTAGCIGIDVGGSAGTPADKEFWKRYQEIKPSKMLINLLGKGAGKVDNLEDQQQTGEQQTGSDTTSEPPETLESVSKKLAEAISGLNTSLGYAPPSPPAPSTAATPVKPTAKPAATSSASNTGKTLANTSEQISRLEEAAANTNQPAQVVPLPINSGMTQIAYGGIHQELQSHSESNKWQ